MTNGMEKEVAGCSKHDQHRCLLHFAKLISVAVQGKVQRGTHSQNMLAAQLPVVCSHLQLPLKRVEATLKLLILIFYILFFASVLGCR